MGRSSPSVDVVFGCLEERRRRAVLYCLCTYRTAMSVGDLATEVAAWERRTSTSEPPVEGSIYTSLADVHLPRLAAAELVEYEPRRGTVALSTDGELIEPLVLVAAALDEFVPGGYRSGGGSPAVYRWTCPICGASTSGVVTSGRPRDVAVNNFKTHLRSAGGDHGPSGSVPKRPDLEDLEEFVEVSSV